MRDTGGATRFRVVAVAASAGGISALSKFLSVLPRGFPVPIVVVQHLDPKHPSLLAGILARRTPLNVQQVDEGMHLEGGTVYLAPPDHHVLVNADGTLSVSQAPPVRFLRPSADVLFDSAAAAFRDGVIAVVLTGTGGDGSDGLQAVKAARGTVISQDPVEAEFPGMPSAAVATGDVDFVLPLGEIAPTLVTLVGQAA